MRCALAWLALWVCLASPARAQEPPTTEIVLVAALGEDARIDLARVSTRLGTETGAEVHIGSDASAEGATLHIGLLVAPGESDRVVLVLARADGSRLERTAELPTDAAERTESLAIFAVNMFRDESAELLALLRPVSPSPSPSATLISPHPDPLPSTGEGGELSPTSAPSGPPFLRLGVAAQLGSVSRGGSADLDFIGGLEVAWTPLPFLAIGVRDIAGGGTSQGSAWHADGSPFVELGLVLDFVTIYAELGAHLQIASAGARGIGAGVAPFLAAGIRFRLAPEVSLGADTTVRVVATDSFFSGLYELPQLAVPWTGGLSLLFHVS